MYSHSQIHIQQFLSNSMHNINDAIMKMVHISLLQYLLQESISKLNENLLAIVKNTQNMVQFYAQPHTLFDHKVTTHGHMSG